MPRRAKTPRFDQYKSFSNTLDSFSADLKLPEGLYEIELGCGRGEFALELARRYPTRQFAGIDIKSDRMWFGAKLANSENIQNLKYIRADAKNLAEVFKPGTISGIWLTFPDPYPKARQAKHRLTHINYLNVYRKLLSSEGWIRLKTDNDELFEWTMQEISTMEDWQINKSGRDVHQDILEDSDWRIQTAYERKFIGEGKTINYTEIIALN